MSEPVRPPDPGPAARPASGRTLVLGVAATVVVLLAAGALVVSGLADEAEDGGAELPPSAVGDRQELADRVEPTRSEPLPDLPLEAFGGGEDVRTADYRGAPLVLNFWASWCSPCVEEMPDLQEVADAAPGGLVVLGVNIDDDHDKAAAMVDSLGVSYDLAVDADGDLFREIEAFGMPTTLFVTADGVIRYRHTGPLDAAAITGLAQEHLGVEQEAQQ